jgi:hypothetical protein
MAIRLTSAQRCVLADSTRAAVLGWLINDPQVQVRALRIANKATTIGGFSFSRFADMAIAEIGGDFRPGSSTPDLRLLRFPLSLTEVVALANDIELEIATDDEMYCAGLIVAHSPYGQPAIGSPEWRNYLSVTKALKLPIDYDASDWREIVRDRLRAFRRAVAAAAVSHLVPAE